MLTDTVIGVDGDAGGWRSGVVDEVTKKGGIVGVGVSSVSIPLAIHGQRATPQERPSSPGALEPLIRILNADAVRVRVWFVMVVNCVAAGAAIVAAVLVVVFGAAEPAQAIVATSAAAAFLAILARGRRSRIEDWFTVRLLLAGNLVVFGVGNFGRLRLVLATFAIVSGSVLIALTALSYLRRVRGGHSVR